MAKHISVQAVTNKSLSLTLSCCTSAFSSFSDLMNPNTKIEYLHYIVTQCAAALIEGTKELFQMILHFVVLCIV